MTTDLDKAIEIFGFLMAQEFADAAPKKTGTLARSFPGTFTYEDSTITFILPNYVKFVEFGTPPHIIRPVNGKALKFKGKDGKDVIVKQVMHPGTVPNPFIRDTFFRKAKMNLQKALKAADK